MARKSKCTVLQQQHDQKQFGSSYYFITQVEGLDAAHKLLLITMCDNVWLNGQVDWTQKTYAVKTGTHIKTIGKHFSKYVELGILQLIGEKKRGTKDKYRLIYSNIKKLIKSDKPFTKISNDDEQPVTPVIQTCNTGDPKPVTPVIQNQVHRCTTYNSYNKNNSYNEDEESSFRNDSSSKTQKKPRLTDTDIQVWLLSEDL